MSRIFKIGFPKGWFAEIPMSFRKEDWKESFRFGKEVPKWDNVEKVAEAVREQVVEISESIMEASEKEEPLKVLDIGFPDSRGKCSVSLGNSEGDVSVSSITEKALKRMDLRIGDSVYLRNGRIKKLKKDA